LSFRFYRIAGWALRSDRLLPYLSLAMASAPHDIDVRFGPVDAMAGEPVATPIGFRIFAPELAEYANGRGIRARIEHGDLVTVELAPGVTDGELQTSLFGPIFGLLCHQRGRPPLHAGAVVADGRALVVAGNSGIGKSTTIRALSARGHRLLSDDQVVIETETGMIHPYFPSNKLWADTAGWFGEPLDPFHRVARAAEKFHVAAPGEFQQDPAPLGSIFVLGRDTALMRPELRRLHGAEAAATLARMVVRADAAAALGTQATIFHGTARLAASIPVYLVRRPDDPAQLGRLVDLLLETTALRGRVNS
jgi:hypothetical protein